MDYSSPDPQVPAQWRGAEVDAGRDDAVLARWWRELDDPVLEGLVRDAWAANKDLKSALAGLREARARRDLARSTLAPSVAASASARRSEAGGELAGGAARELYNAAFDAAWEPDIFGAGRRGLEAAEAELQTSLAVLRDTRVSLLAEVARNYVELRTGERRLTIAEANLAAQQELFDLIRWRREAGLVSQLDQSQALTLLEQARLAYESAVLSALVEVEHALVLLANTGQRRRELALAVDSARRTLE